MLRQDDLKENTHLIDKYFPFNIFCNTGKGDNILHLHWHDNIEIIYVIEGHAIFDIGGQSLEAVPGDIFFVNSGRLHSGYSIENTEVVYYAIVFGKSLFASYSPDPYYTKYINPFLEGNYCFPVALRKNDEHYNDIRSIILSIINEFEQKLPGFEIMIRNCIHSLAVYVLRHYVLPESTMENRISEAYIDVFKHLLSYISTHYPERITVKQAARLVNLSPYYFCHLFKRITGRTFVEYLNLYRINKAEELLRNTTLSVTEVAEKVGIGNINYFSKMFKQFKRYSPSQCKKSNETC